MSELHYQTCHLCEAMCGIAVEHRDGEVLSIKGDPKDVLSRGHICAKATGLQDVYTDPDRLRKPLKKTCGGWTEIGWEEALDEVAQRIVGIQSHYGQDGFGTHSGRQIAHSFQSLLMIMPFRSVLKSRSIFTGSTIDQMPHNLAYYLMYGHQLLITVPDIERTDYLLMLGANPAVSNGGMMSAGAGCAKIISDIRDRGGQVVLIDPRRTETARYCSEHHFIHPASDVLFLIGIVKTLFARGLANPGRLAPNLENRDRLAALFADFELEEIASVTGIAAVDIERIAVDFAAAPRAICYGRVGTSMQEFGGSCQWLIQVINVITGNLDEPGGMLFANPAMSMRAGSGSLRGSWDRYRSRVSGRPEVNGELPVCVLAEEITTPGEGQIRGMLIAGSNAALSLVNGKEIEAALAQLEFMVSVDPYLNETSRHADIILPPVSVLERSHYDLYYTLYNVRNFAKYSPPLFKPDSPGFTDFEIFRELALRIAEKRARSWPSRILRKGLAALIRRLLKPERLLDLGLRFGPYGSGINPFKRGLSLKKLREHPHGIELGPLQRQMPELIQTPNRLINLVPALYEQDIPRIRQRWFEGPANPFGEFDLLLISRLQTRTLGWMHNSYRLVKGRDSCTLYIHPQDAAARGIQEGEVVRIHSRTGRISAPAQITETVMPGVVCMPHSWGHRRSGVKLSVATAQPGSSFNDLTDAGFIDTLSGNAITNGIPVQVLCSSDPASTPL